MHCSNVATSFPNVGALAERNNIRSQLHLLNVLEGPVGPCRHRLSPALDS
jgi:hypothetical protein